MSQFQGNIKKTYDLEERTAKFSEQTINLVKKINRNDINRNIVQQLIRSSTSIGANYCEANASSSKRDFRNKIYICKKESNETKYWLRMLMNSNPDFKEEIKRLWEEAHQFHLIFQKVTSSLDKNNKIEKV